MSWRFPSTSPMQKAPYTSMKTVIPCFTDPMVQFKGLGLAAAPATAPWTILRLWGTNEVMEATKSWADRPMAALFCSAVWAAARRFASRWAAATFWKPVLSDCMNDAMA
eukprot:CAMPEP_0174927952 /NCGR_PEP_ID=MMETSP1355-20121228/22643_1 /TAXON_ID=464990 /ORGANISM="Hemiselmis tepida, Strain CCMP443" /LENGTH=108 /DNA_ID=CAMNT_0016174091 /DNA_START=28 /DNA_END=350 /DNA_ORIENTATION=+